jgi:TruD family tRNA pseudouridine synthase
MSIPRTRESYMADQATIKRLTEQDPNFSVVSEPPNFTATNLKKVGISHLPVLAGDGYIKLYHEDFIVEELTLDGRALTISPEPQLTVDQSEQNRAKVWATVIKRGIGTPEAGQLLATKLGVTTREIGWAGLKDGQALTAQEFSFNNTVLSDVQAISIPGMLLKDIRPAPGMLQPGQLWGNRFTIYVRTGNINSYTLTTRIEELKTKGVLNFFSLQRFGTRLNGHNVGRAILHQKYEEAARIMITQVTPHESMGLGKLRRDAADEWGNWEEMSKILGTLPNYFHDELNILEGLQRFRNNFPRALGMAQEQIKLCIYGYFSFCFNQVLSKLEEHGERPDNLPQLSSEAFAQELYAYILPEERIGDLDFSQLQLPFLNLRPKTLETIIIPSIHSVTPAPDGHVFHFDLPKGAYATSFLSQILNIYQGNPVPEWVGKGIYDTRTPLGYRPLNETSEKVGSSFAESPSEEAE